MGGRFGARIGVVEVVARNELELALQRRLDRGDADLTVTLHAVAVAAGEQRALPKHRKIERGSGAKLLVVEIAADGAGYDRSDTPPWQRRRHAHHAKERRELEFETPRHGPDHAILVEGNDDVARLIKVVRQCAR